ILIAVFFLLQKHLRGWFIFPFHSEVLKHTWADFWYSFRMACVRDTFYVHYRFYLFLFLMVLSVIASVRNKRARYLSDFIPSFIIYYYVDDMRAGRLLPGVPFFILF